MDHRSPLRDLTSFNIPAFEITEMEISNDSNKKKPRFSVIKAFDPLYDSPQRIFSDISDNSSNSTIFENAIENDQNNENVNPLLSNLIDISDISEDFLIDDIKNFTEEIINEALNNIFAEDSVCQPISKEQMPEILSEDSVLLTENNITHVIKVEEEFITEQEESKLFIDIPELLDIKHICDNDNTVEHFEILLQSKDEELSSLQTELLEIKPEFKTLKLKMKEIEREIIAKDENIGKYIKAVEHLENLLKEKDDDLAKLGKEISEIKPLHEEAKLKVIEYEEAKNSAEEKVAKCKEEFQLSIAKTVEDQMKKNLQESNTQQELKVLLSKKDEEIKMLNERILVNECKYADLDMRIKEYEEAKNRAEEQVAKCKEEFQLSIAKTVEDQTKKNLQESNTQQELKVLLSKKDEEIKMLNERILVNECEYADLDMRIKEYENILGSHAELLTKQTTELENLKEENQWARKHLSNQEIAFGDVYDKYERCKRIIEGYKTNEEILKDNCQMLQDVLQKYEKSRELLQQEADVKYKQWDVDLRKESDEYKAETSKLQQKIKHLEIKNSSLASTLAQKTHECKELTELCQEITERC